MLRCSVSAKLFGVSCPKRRTISSRRSASSSRNWLHFPRNAQLQQTVGQQQSLAENRVKSEGDLRQRRTDLDMAITRFNRDNEPFAADRVESDFSRFSAIGKLCALRFLRAKSVCLLAQQTMQQASDAYNAWQGQPNRPSDAEE